ncbi:hypothetical protein EVAR_57801_1 [Eumeta japonica]|uniref:Uncharacterized protein n=1 Tax=Eumeta variegata TaxID=151549 RepID=A0A4C1Y6Q0_EUMVA|nr:hypothetical protein EVAR_57801_1 [Eumeta japonica]
MKAVFIDPPIKLWLETFDVNKQPTRHRSSSNADDTAQRLWHWSDALDGNVGHDIEYRGCSVIGMATYSITYSTQISISKKASDFIFVYNSTDANVGTDHSSSELVEASFSSSSVPPRAVDPSSPQPRGTCRVTSMVQVRHNPKVKVKPPDKV